MGGLHEPEASLYSTFQADRIRTQERAEGIYITNVIKMHRGHLISTLKEPLFHFLQLHPPAHVL